MPRPRKYPEELLDRGVRLVFESERPIAQVARDLGVHPEALRKRVRRAEADAGKRTDLLTTKEREEIRKLRRENYELRRANEILKSASVFFAKELDPDRPSAALTSGSSPSARPWACRRPPITSGPRASARRARAKTSASPC